MDQVVTWWFTLSNWQQFWHVLLYIVIVRFALAPGFIRVEKSK